MSFFRDLLFLQGFPTEPLFGPTPSTRPAPAVEPVIRPEPGAGPLPATGLAERQPRDRAARAA